MQIQSARPRSAPLPQLPSIDAASAAAAPTQFAASSESSAPANPARAAYSRVTQRLENRLGAPLPEDVKAQPRSLFQAALERIRNTLLGA